MSKPILSLDFDGVLNSYSTKWKGADQIPDPPTPGARAALELYLSHFDVQIFSSRSHQQGGISAMQEWCIKHFGYELSSQLGFPIVKPPALIGLDDRVLTFNGEWPDLSTLKNFRPWNKR